MNFITKKKRREANKLFTLVAQKVCAGKKKTIRELILIEEQNIELFHRNQRHRKQAHKN
jgi:hypothetical protein